MVLNMTILVALLLTALWTVMTRSLLRCAIGLALTSALVSVAMFRLNSPLAAVFELSVCAGLISVLFISTITLTNPITREEMTEYVKERIKRFWYLPFIIVAAGIGLSLIRVHIDLTLPAPEAQMNVRSMIWNVRQLDLLGQIIILLTGVFGIIVLFKEMAKK